MGCTSCSSKQKLSTALPIYVMWSDPVVKFGNVCGQVLLSIQIKFIFVFAGAMVGSNTNIEVTLLAKIVRLESLTF